MIDCRAFFFFQAEDGIRDIGVTGVQTCALPICQPVAETKKNLSAIIERSKSRGARVLLAGMYTTSNAGEGYEREIDEVFKSLAKEHAVSLIPFFLEGVAGEAELNQQRLEEHTSELQS